jgi:hypothetical protein
VPGPKGLPRTGRSRAAATEADASELGGVERCRESGAETWANGSSVPVGIRNLGGVSWRSPGPAGSWSAGRQEHPILAGGRDRDPPPVSGSWRMDAVFGRGSRWRASGARWGSVESGVIEVDELATIGQAGGLRLTIDDMDSLRGGSDGLSKTTERYPPLTSHKQSRWSGEQKRVPVRPRRPARVIRSIVEERIRGKWRSWSQLFGISEVTVRSDLDALAGRQCPAASPRGAVLAGRHGPAALARAPLRAVHARELTGEGAKSDAKRVPCVVPPGGSCWMWEPPPRRSPLPSLSGTTRGAVGSPMRQHRPAARARDPAGSP